MSFIKTTDAELRTLIFKHPRVVVKFTKPNCPVCEKMGKLYLQFSQHAQYQDITFLLMNADESPVSSQEVNLTETPFFAIYLDGILKRCGLISEEAGLRGMLQELRS